MFDNTNGGGNGTVGHGNASPCLDYGAAGVPAEGAGPAPDSNPRDRIVTPQFSVASDFTLHNQNDSAQRNSLSGTVNPASIPAVTNNMLGPDRVAIDMASAARGAAIVAELQRRERRQDIEDIIADTLWDAEDGSMGHRRLAEAVLAELIRRGLDVFALDAT
jgi:hypothetical protein